MSQNPLSAEIVIQEEVYQLLSQRAAWRPRMKQLILADLHIGKSTHFRKNGLPAVKNFYLDDLRRLEQLLQRYPVSEVVILGDLFHSSSNEEHREFFQWLKKYPKIRWILTSGNHDVHSHRDAVASESALHICSSYVSKGIRFAHTREPSDAFLFHGHEHPVYTLKGRGALRYTGPCFVYKQLENRLILPAFGSLTGGARVTKRGPGDQIFLIAEDQVIVC